MCAVHFALHVAKAVGKSCTITFLSFFFIDFLFDFFCCRFSEIIDDLAHLVDKTDSRIRNETRRVKLVETKSASCGESFSIIKNKSRLSISWTNPRCSIAVLLQQNVDFSVPCGLCFFKRCMFLFVFEKQAVVARPSTLGLLKLLKRLMFIELSVKVMTTDNF